MKEKKYFKKNDKLSLYNTRLYGYGSKRNNYGEWDNYGEGYRQAIELIEREVLENDRKNQDFLIYPYCFLIRHFIEIRLKEIIYEGTKKLYNEPKKAKGHRLISLLEKAQNVLKDFWGESYQEPPKIVSIFIKELNTIDEGSDRFRYPFDLKGDKSIAETEINFKNLSEYFEEVKWYFEEITEGLVAEE